MNPVQVVEFILSAMLFASAMLPDGSSPSSSIEPVSTATKTSEQIKSKLQDSEAPFRHSLDPDLFLPETTTDSTSYSAITSTVVPLPLTTSTAETSSTATTTTTVTENGKEPLNQPKQSSLYHLVIFCSKAANRDHPSCSKQNAQEQVAAHIEPAVVEVASTTPIPITTTTEIPQNNKVNTRSAPPPPPGGSDVPVAGGYNLIVFCSRNPQDKQCGANMAQILFHQIMVKQGQVIKTENVDEKKKPDN